MRVVTINGWCGAVAACTLLLAGGAPAALAQGHGGGHGGGHGFHMPMPDQQLFLQCTPAEGPAVEQAIPTGPPGAAADLQLTLDIPKSTAPLRITRYLPKARQVQEVTEAEGGAPAIRLQVVGRKQSFELWLVADHPERNRLTSLIGTWRYMAVAGDDERAALFAQFENERTRDPQVLVAVEGQAAPVALPARAGETREFSGGRQRVTVREFLPHFGLDAATNQPVNQSARRINPAARVEVAEDGKTQSSWLFAKFPEFQAHGSAELPLRMRLDCPVELERPAPDMVIVTVARARHEVWLRHAGQISTRPLERNEPVDVPASNYVFALTAFVPSGRLSERYEPADTGGNATALCVEAPAADGKSQSIWLELGRPRVVDTPAGPLTLLFASRPGAATTGG